MLLIKRKRGGLARKANRNKPAEKLPGCFPSSHQQQQQQQEEKEEKARHQQTDFCRLNNFHAVVKNWPKFASIFC